ncbi:unnamed protein product [Linum tenue]|uniref:Uncharacterized protein n=1 Tax=Linum tenue TaxID=586396 RepID=A0AAV0Q4A1_9ROSI|nr:unnamed protein product [Linum tenue]
MSSIFLLSPLDFLSVFSFPLCQTENQKSKCLRFFLSLLWELAKIDPLPLPLNKNRSSPSLPRSYPEPALIVRGKRNPTPNPWPPCTSPLNPFVFSFKWRR